MAEAFQSTCRLWRRAWPGTIFAASTGTQTKARQQRARADDTADSLRLVAFRPVHAISIGHVFPWFDRAMVRLHEICSPVCVERSTGSIPAVTRAGVRQSPVLARELPGALRVRSRGGGVGGGPNKIGGGAPRASQSLAPASAPTSGSLVRRLWRRVGWRPLAGATAGQWLPSAPAVLKPPPWC